MRFGGREHATGLGRERGMVEPERVADEHARIELGRIETVV